MKYAFLILSVAALTSSVQAQTLYLLDGERTRTLDAADVGETIKLDERDNTWSRTYSGCVDQTARIRTEVEPKLQYRVYSALSADSTEITVGIAAERVLAESSSTQLGLSARGKELLEKAIERGTPELFARVCGTDFVTVGKLGYYSNSKTHIRLQASLEEVNRIFEGTDVGANEAILFVQALSASYAGFSGFGSGASGIVAQDPAWEPFMNLSLPENLKKVTDILLRTRIDPKEVSGLELTTEAVKTN